MLKSADLLLPVSSKIHLTFTSTATIDWWWEMARLVYPPPHLAYCSSSVIPTGDRDHMKYVTRMPKGSPGADKLQNSPYFVFLLFQVRESSQTKGLERGWKQRARLGRLICHALLISLVILRKKPTVLQSKGRLNAARVWKLYIGADLGWTIRKIIWGFLSHMNFFSLTNGRGANWAPEVEFSPFRALSRRQMTLPFCS